MPALVSCWGCAKPVIMRQGAINKTDFFSDSICSAESESDSQLGQNLSMYRLTLGQYDATMRSLLMLSYNPSEHFNLPSQATGGVFSNNAGSLNMNPDLLDLFYTSAGTMMAEVRADATRSAKIFACSKTITASSSRTDQITCAKDIITRIGGTALRRPLTAAELSAYIQVMDDIKSLVTDFRDQVSAALEAMFSSPNFLYRMTSPTLNRSSVDYVLASALSYYIWNTAPDAELLTLASKGQLQNQATYMGQASRLMADPKADQLVQSFVDGFLLVDQMLETTQEMPDPVKYAMAEETELMFRNIAKKNQPLSDILNSRATYVNKTLAHHYGAPEDGLTDDVFIAQDLTKYGRKGFLTSGTYNVAINAGAIQRGVGVITKFLCFDQPIPVDAFSRIDPPPGSQQLPTTRERIAYLTDPKNESCYNCHSNFNPVGLSLVPYDKDGSYRAQENGVDIDASGKIPTGETFVDAQDLSDILAQKNTVKECLTKAFYSQALARTITKKEQCKVSAMAKQVEANGFDYDAMIKSMAAQMYANVIGSK